MTLFLKRDRCILIKKQIKIYFLIFNIDNQAFRVYLIIIKCIE